MDTKLYRIISKRSKEVGIDVNKGEEIWKALGFFVKDIIKSADMENTDTFKSVFIKDLGTVYPNRKFIEREKKERAKKNEDI